MAGVPLPRCLMTSSLAPISPKNYAPPRLQECVSKRLDLQPTFPKKIVKFWIFSLYVKGKALPPAFPLQYRYNFAVAHTAQIDSLPAGMLQGQRTGTEAPCQNWSVLDFCATTTIFRCMVSAQERSRSTAFRNRQFHTIINVAQNVTPSNDIKIKRFVLRSSLVEVGCVWLFLLPCERRIPFIARSMELPSITSIGRPRNLWAVQIAERSKSIDL